MYPYHKFGEVLQALYGYGEDEEEDDDEGEEKLEDDDSEDEASGHSNNKHDRNPISPRKRARLD
jgi:hypothetical protein